MKAVCLLLWGCALACAQSPPGYSADSNLVMLDVQAIDRATGAVLDLLGPSDFEVYDDGRMRPVRVFGVDTPPMEIVFLKYLRPGMAGPAQRRDFTFGLANGAAELRSFDSAAVLSGSKMIAPSLPFSHDRQAITRALQYGRPVDNDRLFDAVVTALSLFPAGGFPDGSDPRRRRIIMALTDDIERRSSTTSDALIARLFDAGVTLHEVMLAFLPAAPRVGLDVPRPPAIPGLPEPPVGGGRISGSIKVPPTGGESLVPIAEATGGEVISGDEFETNFPALIHRLRLRYMLGIYVPPGARRFHTIEVRLTPEKRGRYPNALLRTRNGYYSVPSGSR